MCEWLRVCVRACVRACVCARASACVRVHVSPSPLACSISTESECWVAMLGDGCFGGLVGYPAFPFIIG